MQIPNNDRPLKLVVLAVKAGYLHREEGWRMYQEETLSQIKAKINRLIDTVDVPATTAGRELVLELFIPKEGK